MNSLKRCTVWYNKVQTLAELKKKKSEGKNGVIVRNGQTTIRPALK